MTLLRHLVLAVLLAAPAAPALAQVPEGRAASPAVEAGYVGLPVPFLAAPPVIDGRLDANLGELKAWPLPLRRADPEAKAMTAPSYRIAYGTTFLYVFVEIETPRLTQRDRAYQNGDGVILVVARPVGADPASFLEAKIRADRNQPATNARAPAAATAIEPATREFYVLGFSPGTPAARWQQRFVWYRNVDLGMRPLDDTVVATASANGRSFFEILVPWRDVYPHHPWLSEAVGFNLCVTRALGETSRARFCAVEDGRVDSEQSGRRYAPLSFYRPPADGAGGAQATGVQAFGVLDRNWLSEGVAPRLRLATYASAPAKLPFVVRVLSGEGTRADSRALTLDVPVGSHVHDIEVPSAAVTPGGYAVTWDLGEGAATGRLGLSVVPAAEPSALRARLEKARARVNAGSYATLQFQLAEIDRQQQQLRPTDTAADLRVATDRFLADLRDAEAGIDAVAARRGMFRRAYRSAVDGRLQPYSVKLPADYQPGRRYPLLVFLHGSGQDDRTELTRAWLPQDFILLAPNGRGTSNWYTSDHAQDDIREAVADALATYSIDSSRIVLAGFSMGGYGVYRTYKEDPKRYAGLAVFSGLPRVPQGAGEAPDFLEKEDLANFGRVPMFIFHGGKDRNCPIEQTRALVDRLKQAGANVHFEYEEDKGHEAPGENALRAFGEWISARMQPSTRVPSYLVLLPSSFGTISRACIVRPGRKGVGSPLTQAAWPSR